MKTPTIVIFISGHGFGHASRIRVLLGHFLKDPKLANYHFLLITTVTQQFFEKLTPSKRISIHAITHDMGLWQDNFYQASYNSTIEQWESIIKEKPQLFTQLYQYTESKKLCPKIVLSDSSPSAFIYSSNLNIPGFFLGNFTWCDIYKELEDKNPNFRTIHPILSQDYQKAQKCFRLPLHTSLEPYTDEKIIDIPHLLPSPIQKENPLSPSLSHLPLKDPRTKVLLSFGGFDFSQLPLNEIFSLKNEYLFFTSALDSSKALPPNLVCLPSCLPNYQEIIHYCDIIFTKPGYGILMDCLCEKKPILHTERGPFAEYPILRQWLDTSFPSLFISSQDFLEGNWKKYLEQLKDIKKPFPENSGKGSEIIVNEILKWIN